MRRLLWPVAAAFLVAGCSQAPGPGAAAENQPDPRPLGGALHFTAAESAALHRAEERGVQECMASQGFAYSAVPAGDVQRTAATSPYGLLTRDRAAQDGYGLTVRKLETVRTDPNARQVSALPEGDRRGWEEALKGAVDGPRKEIALQDGPTLSVPTDSCVSAAREKLYGASWERTYFALQHVRNSIVDDTLDHPLVKAAERKWAACMRDEGLRYQDREDPLKAVKKRLASADSDAAAIRATGREELRVAARDATCQAESGLAEQVARAQAQVESALPRARTAGLEEFRAARRAALKRAG
jgi:hypothetical protein